MIEGISAVTFATHDMARSVRFYASLGFELKFGGEDAAFTSFFAGTGFVNLTLQPQDCVWDWWGRTIFHVADVDEIFRKAQRSRLFTRQFAERRFLGRALFPYNGS